RDDGRHDGNMVTQVLEHSTPPSARGTVGPAFTGGNGPPARRPAPAATTGYAAALVPAAGPGASAPRNMRRTRAAASPCNPLAATTPSIMSVARSAEDRCRNRTATATPPGRRRSV